MNRVKGVRVGGGSQENGVLREGRSGNKMKKREVYIKRTEREEDWKRKT